MNILFTLCGRAGSKGFRNKNLKVFLGISLAYYSLAVIELYMKQYTDDNSQIDIVINSDSKELLKLAQIQTRIPVDIIKRDEHLGGDTIAKVAVIKDCLIKMEDKKNYSYDMVVDLDITSPLRTLKDVKNAIDKKLSRKDTDVVYSVTHARRNPYFNMVKVEKGFFGKAIASAFTARQQAPVFYDMNASIYAYSVHALKNKQEETFFNDFCDAIIMKDTGILDIDSEEDFELMQVVAKYLFNHNEEFHEVYEAAKLMQTSIK